ncbi:hypothetical protein DL771_000108 [Monosporascus sp. 5C6A]|nr:hypothetical protein DL771_000108 [Monosporascus sp. 5C6A]
MEGRCSRSIGVAERIPHGGPAAKGNTGETERSHYKQQVLLPELSRQLADTKKQMGDEYMQVREAIGTSATVALQISFAEGGQSSPVSQTDNIKTLSTGNVTSLKFADTVYCTIDTFRVEDGQ